MVDKVKPTCRKHNGEDTTSGSYFTGSVYIYVNVHTAVVLSYYFISINYLRDIVISFISSVKATGELSFNFVN